MRRIILAAAVALLPLAAEAQFWNPSAVNGAGVSKKTITAPAFCLTTDCAVEVWTGGGELRLKAGAGVFTYGTGNGDYIGGIAGNDSSTFYVSSNSGAGVTITATGAASDSIVSASGTLVLSANTTVQTSSGFTIGNNGTKIAKSIRAASTIDIASIAANLCATDSTITVTGAVTGAECIVGSPAALTAGLIQTCFVSAADTVKLRTCNSTAGAIDQASATYSVRVFNP